MASSTSSWPQKSALILCDYQNFILQGQTGGEENAKKAAEKALPLIASARAAEVPVIYVAVRFRKGAPEVSEDNKAFSAYKSAGAIVNLEEGSHGAAFHEAVAPQEGDIVVVKRRFGAFSTTDLHTVLSGLGVKHIVLAGYSTSGVILSSVRWAADADYRITVVEDLCGDRDADVHALLMEKVFPRQAEVVQSTALCLGK